MSAGAKYVMIDGIKPVIFTGLSHDAFKSLGEITSAGFVKLFNLEGGGMKNTDEKSDKAAGNLINNLKEG